MFCLRASYLYNMSVSALAADPESHSYLKLVPGLALWMGSLANIFWIMVYSGPL